MENMKTDFYDNTMRTRENNSCIYKQEVRLNEIIVRWPPDKSDRIWTSSSRNQTYSNTGKMLV